MTVWWMTLLSTYILCLIARTTAKPVYEGDTIRYRNNVVLSFVACSVLVLVAGLRNNVGDTEAYIMGYQGIPSSFQEAWRSEIVEGTAKDKGFIFLSILIKSFLSANPQMLLFMFSLLTITMIFIGYFRTTELLDLAVFLFITTGCYLVTMNGIRQYFASALLFLAFPWIYKRKWYLYLPLVALASTVHGSALVFIPLYFMVNCEAWGKVTKFILFCGVVLYLTYPVSGPIIADLLQESQYGEYGDLLTTEGAGSNMIRVLVMGIPVALSFFGRDMMEGKEKYYNIIVNMSLVNFIAILLATRFWIYARFNMYFTLYMILLLIWCIKYLFDERNRKIVYIVCLGLYGFYYWYETVISLGQKYGSDYINFL